MMARKPPSLPDVFAKPGAAPPRGTPIEDLPQSAEPDAELLTRQSEPEPPPPAPEPSPLPAPEPVVMAETPVPPRMPMPPATPETEAPYVAEPRQPPAASSRGAVVLAVVALAISLTAPFWEDQLLSTLGIRTPVARVAEQSALSVERQDRRTEDIAQRLTAATAQLGRQQAEFVAAMQRADQAAAMIRTMALVRLSDTLRRPMPFAAELAVVRANGTNLGELKPLLDRIEPYAATGIPGTAQLRHDFDALFDQVPRGERGGAASWISNVATWAHLRRPPPPTAATGVDPSLQLLQSASARLADADVQGAIEDTRQVGDTYRSVFGSWMEDAQARVAADSIAERVSDMVAQTLRAQHGK